MRYGLTRRDVAQVVTTAVMAAGLAGLGVLHLCGMGPFCRPMSVDWSRVEAQDRLFATYPASVRNVVRNAGEVEAEARRRRGLDPVAEVEGMRLAVNAEPR